MNELPEWVPEEEWFGYCEMRKLKKKPMTPGAFKRSMETLARLFQQGEDMALVLNQSEDQGYTGLFAVSDAYKKTRGIQAQQAGNHAALLNKLSDRSWAEDLH